jgi:hypothetical protein
MTTGPRSAAALGISLASAKQKVALQIENGSNAEQVVRDHLVKKGLVKDAAQEALQQFVRDLQRGVRVLEGQVEQITGLNPGQIKALERAQALIGRLLQPAPGGRRAEPAKGAKPGAKGRHKRPNSAEADHA